MHVGVRRNPTLLPQVHEPSDFRLQLPLPGNNLHLPANRGIFEPLGHFHENFTHRQLDLKGAVHVGEGCVHHHQVGAVVLEPSVVDLRSMPVRRNITALRRAKRQPDGRGLPGGGVHSSPVQPHFVGIEDFDVRGPRTRCYLLPERRLAQIELKVLAAFRVRERQGGAGVGSDIRVKIA